LQEILDGHEIKALFDSFSEGIVLSDEASSLRWMNPMAEFLLGVQSRDWIGKPIREMVDEHEGLEWVFDDKQPENLRCWQVMGCKDQSCSLWGKLFTDCWTGQSCPLCVAQRSGKDRADPDRDRCQECEIYNSYAHDKEKEILGPNRNRMLLQIRSTWIQNERGDTVGTLRLIRDVTRDRELARMKGGFLSEVSHDLRSPLTSIRSFTEILLNYPDTDSETQREFLAIIRAESQRLDQMIADLVERHQVSSERSEWKNEEVFLPQMIQRILQDHEAILKDKALTYGTALDPRCPKIWAESEKVYYVISTLLQNLVSFTQPGGRIWLRAFPIEGQRDSDRNSLIRFTLSNRSDLPSSPNGSGRPVESSFATPKKAVLDRRKGMSLGFILCKQILEQYGGNLWLENGEEATGSTFHFVLPTHLAVEKDLQEDEREPGLMKRARPRIEKAKKKILIVDDEPNQVNALVVALTKEGYRVHSTTSALKALKMVHEVKPDLMISDISMPEMDGYTLFEEIQKDEASKMIPFIFLSARGDEERFHGLEIGVDDYLSKPYDIKEVAVRVETLLGRMEEYTDLSRFDGLTGALTRKAFEESLGLELTKAKQNNLPISVTMADLDFFKNVNDSYGHIVGDFVLKSFVQFLQNNLRDGEVVLARYGGEEFCIVMPGVRKQKAHEILERIRKSLSETPFLYEKEGLNISITSSFGVSGYPEDGVTADGLIEKSDAALYTAKRRGRNRVVLYGEDLPSRYADAEQTLPT
jgi:diguanylate cyclase (GGDEF)-like protein